MPGPPPLTSSQSPPSPGSVAATTTPTSSGEAPKSDDASALLIGATFWTALPYAIWVWPRIPTSHGLRYWVTAGLAALILLVFVFVKGVRDKLFHTISNYILLATIAALGAVVVLMLSPSDRVLLLKGLSVIYFAFLPGWLYMQFVSTRGQTVWDEYVTSLFRLHVDAYVHLPEPPRRSLFHPIWRQAMLAGETDTGSAIAAEAPNIYRRKFESVYGTVSSLEQFRVENLSPVVIATILMAACWAMVVVPETLRIVPMFGSLSTSGLPRVPVEAFRFGFLGAYFYILQMLVRRYFQNDLKTNAYVNATMRIVVTLLLVWVISVFGLVDEVFLPTAFIIGVFPKVGWDVIVHTLKAPFKGAVPSLKQEYPLSDLDGLTIWYESRLLEEGIEDLQNLATCNVVDVMLHTRIPVERLVDWIDQAVLYLHLGGVDADGRMAYRAQLRGFGVRCATDLEDIFGEEERVPKVLEGLEQALGDGGPGALAKLRAVLLTFSGEPNLAYVRQWKMFTEKIVEPTDRGVVTAAV